MRAIGRDNLTRPLTRSMCFFMLIARPLTHTSRSSRHNQSAVATTVPVEYEGVTAPAGGNDGMSKPLVMF